jgi:hypothetical protein
VHDYEIGSIGQRVEISACWIVFDANQIRESAGKPVERIFARVMQQIDFAPGVQRFTETDFMSAGLQVVADAAQEMDISIVPAGCDCVHEIDNSHATASTLLERSEQ